MDIQLLDNLPFSDAEPLIAEYVDDVIQSFADSDIGQEYIKDNPVGGDWIHSFINMGYLHGEHTLPKMTRADVQSLMENTLPNKLILMDIRSTDHAMGELIALWRFLKEAYSLPNAESIIEYLQSIEDEFAGWMRKHAVPELTQAEASILEGQPITPTEPGPILQDFEMMLELIGDKGIAVSGKLRQFPLKLLADINNRLTKPISLDLKRPQQKSYPPINGLYLLLRATGLVSVVANGKKHGLVINQEVYGIWKTLNPTERYFTLLEAWLVRGKEEMTGESQPGIFSGGDRCFQSWDYLTRKKKHSFTSYGDQSMVSHYPGLHNLALMELFGFITITSGKPEKGKGWRIRTLETSPFGQTMVTLFKNIFVAKGMRWDSEYDVMHPYNELQPFFSLYFPKWQLALTLPEPEFRSGRHIFKVHLGNCWRRIAIDADATLYLLSRLILDSVGFDYDHLDRFTYKDALGCNVRVEYPSDYMEGLATDEVKVGELPILIGSSMEYLFDFGDRWMFEVQLESIESPDIEDAKSASTAKKGKTSTKVAQKESKQSKRKPQGKIIESHGEAPEQYPSYDDDW